MSKTRSSYVVPAKNKILKSKQFSLGTTTAIFLSRTDMSTFKEARTLILESYLDRVIDDDELIRLYDETFSKNPEFSNEFIIINLLFAIMTSKYKNTETTQLTPLLSLQCCSRWFQFHLLFFSICFSVFSREGCSDLELPFCQL